VSDTARIDISGMPEAEAKEIKRRAGSMGITMTLYCKLVFQEHLKKMRTRELKKEARKKNKNRS